MQDRIFYTVCFGFILGVLWRSFLLLDFYFISLLGILAFGLFLYFIFVSENKWGIIITVFVFAICLGIFRFQMVDISAPSFFESKVGQKVSFSGKIIDEPSIKENIQQLILEVESGKFKTKILLSAGLGKDLKYGDKINFTGKLEKPENFDTEQGKSFDYINYLRKDGIFYSVKYPKIEIISRGNGNFIKNMLFAVKEKFLSKISIAIPKPESILMGGLILGEKSAFSQDLRTSFINTGTIHVVALSGYNITIVAEWIMKILAFLPRNFAFGGGILGIVLFIMMAGGASTAIRAGVMAILALIGKATGRNYDVGRALVLAGAGMIFLNPFILAFDVSFELSFIATVAVIFFSPKLEKYFLWIKWKWLRDLVSITVAAYIFVMPFILYKMGNLSFVALPANFLILPFIPMTMLAGFLSGIFGFISSWLALPFNFLSYGLLHYELSTVDFFSHLPFAAITIKNFPLILTVLIYILFAYFLFKTKNIERDNVKYKEMFKPFSFKNLLSPFFFGLIVLAVIGSGLLYYGYLNKNKETYQRMATLLSASVSDISLSTSSNLPSSSSKTRAFKLGERIKEENCEVRGPLPDPACSPGSVFVDATPDKFCVPGYTKTVRNVSAKLKKQVYAEYGLTPQPRGTYEVDHIIPLAIGGDNSIANLFPESALPTPGFKEKDLVEIYLQQEVCAGRADLRASQYQIATDWTVIYNNLLPEQITELKNKIRSWSN